MNTSGFAGANMNDGNMMQMIQMMNAAASNMEGSGGGGMAIGNQGFNQSFAAMHNNMSGNMPTTEGSSGRMPLANMANGNQGQGLQGEGTQNGAAMQDMQGNDGNMQRSMKLAHGGYNSMQNGGAMGAGRMGGMVAGGMGGGGVGMGGGFGGMGGSGMVSASPTTSKA